MDTLPIENAARQALGLLEKIHSNPKSFWNCLDEITALREALVAYSQTQASEQVPAPVAWMYEQKASRNERGVSGWDKKLLFCEPAHEAFKRNITPLYAAPQPVVSDKASYKMGYSKGMADEKRRAKARADVQATVASKPVAWPKPGADNSTWEICPKFLEKIMTASSNEYMPGLEEIEAVLMGLNTLLAENARIEQAVSELHAALATEQKQESDSLEVESAGSNARQCPAAVQEPVKYLANGTRFKMSFFENEDSEGNPENGTYVTCFEGFEKELDGRWVAVVAAEDDCHLKHTAPAVVQVPVDIEQEKVEAYRQGYINGFSNTAPASMANPSIEELCARIKAADDAAADSDYMLDSDDCIAVLRGTWKGPLALDMPKKPEDKTSVVEEPSGVIVSAHCEYATVHWLKQTSDIGGGDPKNSYSWPLTGSLVYIAPPPK